MNTASLVLVSSLLLLQSQPAYPPAATPFDPAAALKRCFDQFKADNSGIDRKRFTYRDHERFASFDAIGIKYSYESQTYDVTWIGDRPYMRLIKSNDKPLSAKDEMKEQELYDGAISGRRYLRITDRNQLADLRSGSFSVDASDALGTNYNLKQTSIESVDKQIVHLIEARLKPNAKSTSQCPWRFRFWISDKTQAIFRYEADVVGNITPFCQDARVEEMFTRVDGVTLPAKLSFRYHKEQNSKVTAFADYTYTNYHRAQSTTTIHPYNEAPNSSNSIPNPPH